MNIHGFINVLKVVIILYINVGYLSECSVALFITLEDNIHIKNGNHI